MKIATVLEAPSRSFAEPFLARLGWTTEEIARKLAQGHPREDALLTSSKHPVFAVADGVTLIQHLIDKTEYPDPSPAGELAEAVCESLVREMGVRYGSFGKEDVIDVFRSANQVARDFNEKQGRREGALDYWDTDLFAATAAFAVVEDGVAYWGSICDSYVLHLDRQGTVLFKSPDCESKKEAAHIPYAGDPADGRERTRHAWRERRNRLNAEGLRVGYGVVTGEKDATAYLNHGSFPLAQGETLVLITDGFERYMEDADFREILREWPEDLQARIASYTARRSAEDPDRYGHERSLIAARL